MLVSAATCSTVRPSLLPSSTFDSSPPVVFSSKYSTISAHVSRVHCSPRRLHGGAATTKQRNRSLHFVRAVHSRHPLPGRSHFQRTRQRRNDPFCDVIGDRMITFAASALQYIVNGQDNPFQVLGDAAYRQRAGRGPSHGHGQCAQ